MNEFWPNRELERLLCEYTGAPRCIVVDNCCNALFLCLRLCLHYNQIAQKIRIPRHTYIGVPYAIKAAGLIPVPNNAIQQPDGHLLGAYQLEPLPIIDSALRLTAGMYQQTPGYLVCLSFTGPYKHLKLQKGGAILTDSEEDEIWLRRASYSGRNYVSYHEDTFTMPEGYNAYLPPMIAALGVQLIKGLPKNNPDLRLPYPDWSVHPAFKQ